MKKSEKDEWSTVSKAVNESRKNASDLITIHYKVEVIVNFKKSCFSGMKDPVNRLRKDKELEGRWCMNVGVNDFFEHFENKVEVLNWTKVAEIISG